MSGVWLSRRMTCCIDLDPKYSMLEYSKDVWEGSLATELLALISKVGVNDAEVVRDLLLRAPNWHLPVL